MESDSFFYQLFQQLPQTLFELLGLPPAQAKSYRFESVELKKAFRIDGLFVPNKRRLPVYFVEVQFQRVPTFYANLFAKAFTYLGENDPAQEWIAVAIFPTRKEEPKHVGPYADLLGSQRVRRIYLEDIADADDPPVGLAVLQLLFATEKEAQVLAPEVTRKMEIQVADSDLSMQVIELVERLLILRFPQYGREEVRMKFKLHDIRESKVWKEAVEEGRTEGLAEGKAERQRELIQQWIAKGIPENRIAELLDVSIDELHRLANGHSR